MGILSFDLNNESDFEAIVEYTTKEYKLLTDRLSTTSKSKLSFFKYKARLWPIKPPPPTIQTFFLFMKNYI